MGQKRVTGVTFCGHCLLACLSPEVGLEAPGEMVGSQRERPDYSFSPLLMPGRAPVQYTLTARRPAGTGGCHGNKTTVLCALVDTSGVHLEDRHLMNE